MIKKVTLVNPLGERFVFDFHAPYKEDWVIKNIDGLGPVDATVNITEIMNSDGGEFNSARTTTRNILITVQPIGSDPEPTRRKFYTMCPLKKKVDIYIETDVRTYKTSGIVEKNSPVIFSPAQTSLISIICPNPYYSGEGEQQVISFSGVEKRLMFPLINNSVSEKQIVMSEITAASSKTILYTGDVDTGLTVTINASGPIVNLSMIQENTNESITIDHSKLSAIVPGGIIKNDVVLLTTHRGNKRIYLIRDGVEYNIQNAIGRDADWFVLSYGYNVFKFSADSGLSDLSYSIMYDIYYEGV